ncbi:MAG: T9SS type A sorting domain-containing protein [Bacteroidota bacterium]|nr:T9SS type A sorting domain-containing protein [Bacteroidota bacterium]
METLQKKNGKTVNQKNKISLIKICFMVCSFVMVQAASAATFTAVSSGNWTDNATWAGNSAPSTNVVNDQIVIPSSISVAANVNLTINGSLASLTVDGTLTATSGDSLWLGLGTLTGTGTMVMGNVVFATYATLAFTGSLTAYTLTTAATALATTASIKVNNKLVFAAGTFTTKTGGSIAVESNTTIMMAGGIFIVSGGSADLTAKYNVHYSTATSTVGVELSGSGLNDVTIDVPAGSSVIAASSIQVNGFLKLTSGVLALGNNTLTIKGDIAATGSGTISSGSASNIIINTVTAPAGSLRFTPTENIVNNFTVNVISGGTIVISSDLEIDGDLNFVNGTITLSNYKLVMGSAGTITGASSTSYVITGSFGFLVMPLVTGTSVNFPIGTVTYYFPTNIQLNTGSSNRQIRANVSPKVYSQGTMGTILSASQHMVNATWMLESDVAANLNINVNLKWYSNAEVNGFDNTKAYISHYTSGAWDVQTSAAAASLGSNMYSIQRANITSLSPFAVFDQTTNTSIAEANTSSQVMDIYPNPTKENIYINNLINIDEMINADIIDMKGQIVAKHTLKGGNKTIPVSELTDGIYFINFYNNSINTTKRFTKI